MAGLCSMQQVMATITFKIFIFVQFLIKATHSFIAKPYRDVGIYIEKLWSSLNDYNMNAAREIVSVKTHHCQANLFIWRACSILANTINLLNLFL